MENVADAIARGTEALAREHARVVNDAIKRVADLFCWTPEYATERLEIRCFDGGRRAEIHDKTADLTYCTITMRSIGRRVEISQDWSLRAMVGEVDPAEES